MRLKGFAHFDHAEPPASMPMMGDFGLAEAFFVMVSATGYLVREGKRLANAALARGAVALAHDLEQTCLDGYGDDINRLIDLQDRLTPLEKHCASVADTAFASADWQQNGRLLGMYSRALRARQSD